MLAIPSFGCPASGLATDNTSLASNIPKTLGCRIHFRFTFTFIAFPFCAHWVTRKPEGDQLTTMGD